MSAMKTRRSQLWTVLVLGLLTYVSVLAAQQQQAPPAQKDQGPTAGNRLTIEVTGGEANKPVENASVYVKTVEQHLIKDKKFEVNVKTNAQGVTHVPDAPMGKVLIQVVADGWKSYGHWHQITAMNEVIKIHLERPPKWY